MDPMEHDLYITPDGQTFPLTVRGGQKRLLQTGMGLIDGLIRFFTRRGPLQDGSTVTFMRLDERRVQMVLARETSCRQGYWDARATALNTFRPNRWVSGPYIRPEPGTLRKVLPDGTVRDLLVFVESSSFAPEDVETQPLPWNVKLTVVFFAANPLFLGEAVDTSYTLVAVDGLCFPACFCPTDANVNRWIFSGTTLYDVRTITNDGTRFALPTITVTGPFNYLSIANQTTGEEVVFTGDVAAGRTLTIDLGYGQKRATDDLGVDYSGYLDGDVGEFHIACEPEAPLGVNTVEVLLAGGDANTVLIISFRPPHVGI